MPEYLAPGVYVEETSFRAKPIEGVSTSTTGFVGPTRRGPLDETPELITSVGDFERIYGGPAPLSFTPVGARLNHLAHAVRAYFDNGGSRLYVARARTPGGDGRASSAYLLGAAATAPSVRFVARSPGAVGNGSLTLNEVASPATWVTMSRAPQGTLVRVGGGAAARPATVAGGFGPFRLNDGDRLTLALTDELGASSAPVVDFSGTPASVQGQPLAPSVNITQGENDQLHVTVGGQAQTITLPPGSHDPAAIALAVNGQLRGASAALSGAGELVLTTDHRGRRASIAVTAPNADLGFESLPPPGAGGGNVDDLDRVTVEEINALLAPQGVTATVSAASLRLELTTAAVGGAVRLQVSTPAGPASAHTALGLGTAVASGVAGATVTYYVKDQQTWVGSDGSTLVQGPDDVAPAGGAEILSLNIVSTDDDRQTKSFEELGYAEAHPRFIGHVLAMSPARRADHLENLYAIEITGAVSAFQLRTALLGNASSAVISLSNGDDGAEPTAAAYESALAQLARLEDVSIVAAPGSSSFTDRQAIAGRVISHCERRRAYRMAVLDTAPDQTPGQARDFRSNIDTKYAAIYYPWIVVANPDARPGDASIPRELTLPPSGFVCGIYARNDSERGVFKAPANEVVRGALRFERSINFAEQEVLNPEGVNCLRTFPGRGNRVWGARIATSDQEWKYVNVRRFFNYLEASIDRGTQWAVFEPNGPVLWSNIRESISEFLYNEWRGGALLGASPKEAFFVRCDRTTMTQSDLDNGRLICEIGVAVIKPAEFVIFRIGQKTADARS
ncbi:phage tail sheath family protein [Sorangium sp. So ce1024]|uniref:phage tail sheath family protein n=1 Tax=Sorangium sp. So ce1024 TaxID=3133327 RepID=UPI003F105524